MPAGPAGSPRRFPRRFIRLGRFPQHEIEWVVLGLIDCNALAGAQVNPADLCPAADTVCDDEFNVLDVQFVLNSLNSTPAECRFTAELDVVPDDEVNVLDVQQILNFF